MRRLAILLTAVVLASPLAAMPEAAQSYRDLARTALARGDGIAADADLDRAKAAGASDAEIAVDRGEAALLQGDRAKARTWLGPGRFASGDEARGWRLLAVLERQDGRLPLAGKALDRALALAPRDPAIWLEIARLRYQGGEELQALEASERALAADPANSSALALRAQWLRSAMGSEAVLPLYEQALASAPDNPQLLFNYAAALGDAGRGADMLKVTRRMLALDPKSPEAFFLQAVLAARAGKTDLARGMLNRAGRGLPPSPAIMLLQGALELEAGNANVAVQVLIPLADSQPDNPVVRNLLARSLLETGDYQQLFARYGAIAARDDATPYLLTVLGRAHEEQGDRAAAALYLDRAAAANPPRLMPRFAGDPAGVLGPRWKEDPAKTALAGAYAASLLGSGNGPEAAQVAGRALSIRPGSGDALGIAGDTDLLAGRPERATERFAASSRVRFSEQLALRMAIAMEQGGRAGEVPAFIAGYLRTFPSSRLAARIAANQAFDAKDWTRARLLLESLRLRGGNRDARLLTTLALAQYRAGDTAAAVSTAERAWQISPASPFAATVYALALSKQGERGNLARQLIAQAARTGGDRSILDEARKNLH